jgi:hypothetical protein
MIFQTNVKASLAFLTLPSYHAFFFWHDPKMQKKIALLIFTFYCFALLGCGQSGALYLDNQNPQSVNHEVKEVKAEQKN